MSGVRTSLWLRWSWRDLRSRPVQVVVIGLIIAIGTGLATSLASLKAWRVASNDASFAALRHHDVRATLPDAGFAAQGALAAAVRGVAGVAAAREQLVLPTQVDLRTGGRRLLVPGVVVGQRIDAEPVVDGIAAARGRALRPADTGRAVAMLDRGFADGADAPSRVALRLSGGATLRSVGWAFQPQYFVSGSGGLNVGAGAADFATVFTSLRTAQRVTGRRGQVNRLVVRGAPGTDQRLLERRIRLALARALPGAGATLTRGEEEESHRLLYRDAEGDNKVWRVLAFLVLFGAALAAYNLTGRTVEAERREIGVGMALGVPPSRLALRPLLMGAQIAVLGAVFGVGFGLLLMRMFRSLLVSQLPLPVVETPFQVGTFLAGASLGVVLPLAGVLLPVVRAVRMRSIEAIRIGFRAAAGGGLAPLLARIPAPGSTLAQMPVRNVARAPRRTLITVVGIGAIVALVVTFSGLVDSFLQPMDRARAEAIRGVGDRIVVSLDRYRPADGAAVRGVAAAATVGSARAQSAFPVTLDAHGERLDAALTVFDPGSPGWLPSLRSGTLTAASRGIVLAPQAAHDLHVGVGDLVGVRHPRADASGSVRLVRERVRVDAIHGSPLRPLAFGAGAVWGARTGTSGLANGVEVVPRAGATREQVVAELFGRPGVASVQAVAGPIEALDDAMGKFLGYIYATEAFVLLLALLVGFNSAAINADERRREHATMFAYGVPRRAVLVQSVAEGAIVGLLSSIVGLALGTVLIGWIVGSIVPQTFPDLETSIVVTATTLAVAGAIGIGACALAPLFTARRLRRMDVASTLRVME